MSIRKIDGHCRFLQTVMLSNLTNYHCFLYYRLVGSHIIMKEVG